jgi:6-phosphofructokinase 1
MSALVTGADWVLIPEAPQGDGWEDRMCAALDAACASDLSIFSLTEEGLSPQGRKAGRRCSLVIIAEGAVDSNGKQIKAEYDCLSIYGPSLTFLPPPPPELSFRYVRKTIEQKLGHETRSTLLGHVQRGGTASAFDRNMVLIRGGEKKKS